MLVQDDKEAARLEARKLRLERDTIALRERQVRMLSTLTRHAEQNVDRLREAYLHWETPTRSEELTRISKNRAAGFTSSPYDRQHGSNRPFWGSISEHARTRAAGRLICGLSGIADGVIRGIGCYVVGTGYEYDLAPKKGRTPPPGLVEAIKREVVDEFLDRNFWAGQEVEGFYRSRRDGELFHMREETENGYLDVSVVEPEEIAEPPGRTDDETYGVKTNGRRTDRPLGYFVAFEDPIRPKLYDAGEVVGCKINVDARVKRGLSDFCYDLYDTIRTAGRLIDHVGQGAAIQASLAIIREHELASTEQVKAFAATQAATQKLMQQSVRPDGGGPQYEEDFYPGKILDMKKGTKFVNPPFASNVDGYLAVAQGLLRSVGVKWQAPEWIVSADASNNNYASAIVAESPFVGRCYLERSYYQRYYLSHVRAAVSLAARRGRIVVAGKTWTADEIWAELDLKAKAPKIETRDQTKDATANKTYIEAGVKSPQTVRQEQDLDNETEDGNFAEWKQKQADFDQANAPPPDVDPEQARQDAESARAVQRSQAILDVQTAYHSRTLERSAAIANVVLSFGIDAATAGSLFPELPPPPPAPANLPPGPNNGPPQNDPNPPQDPPANPPADPPAPNDPPQPAGGGDQQ